jgi:hypothetical protein
MQAGSTLGIGDANGILSAGASGNVQVSGTRTYNSVATYEYYGSQTPQSTGNFTTTTTSGTYPCQISNMIINKTTATNIVNLTNTTDITGGGGGTLTLTKGILVTSSTAATAPWIRIASGSSVSPSGGSANSFVDGYIRKEGNTAFIFPTGDGTKWRRIEMSAPSISTEFEAMYVNSAYVNTSTMSATPTVLNHVSLLEYWMLSKPLGADAATAKVKLYWENASQSGLLKFDSLAVGRWSGTSWEDANCYTGCPANWTSSTAQRTYTGSASGTGAGTIQSNTVSSFSPFTLASIGAFSPNPLPIELLSFTATLKGNITQLDWTTASETNNDFFTVERTRDGFTYETVGTLKGAGNSNELLSYRFYDLLPYNGISYYRLKQTDYDGKTSFSALAAINNSDNGENPLIVAPNPGSANVLLSFASDKDGEATIKIYDNTGNLLLSQVKGIDSGSNNINIDISGFAKGLYFVTVLLPGNEQEMKKVRMMKY